MNILNSSFLEHFANLKAPRIERSKEHLLKDIIATAILAIISGADGWVAIEAYGNTKYEWLKSFLELPNGIPSHDTFSLLLCPKRSAAVSRMFLELGKCDSRGIRTKRDCH